jgi:hypothetical protein
LVVFQGGVLVAIIRGANSPLLLRLITEQLAHEHKVIDGSAERKEVRLDHQLLTENLFYEFISVFDSPNQF